MRRMRSAGRLVRGGIAGVVVLMAVGAGSAVAAPAVPTFKNGMAQNVFSLETAIHGEAWVESSFDSDGDGERDRIHIDYTRPQETETDALKVPVVMEASPYYAGTADVFSNWAVDHELGFPPASRPLAQYFAGTNTSPNVSSRHESTWVPRGFAVVHAESAGTGHSDGCPTSGDMNESLSAVAVIDWLNGRAKAYTTRTGDVEVAAPWTTGKVGMIGTSYNGTIPIGAASTGVEGLDAIVPISAISDWYDYYRANGLVRAPHSSTNPTGDNNEFQGEDLDVLADIVYSRQDEGDPRTICRPVIAELAEKQDRATGNRSPFWDRRNYMKDVANIRAATLIAHGNVDFNVMTKHAAQLYEALKANGVPHQFYFHQGGHGGGPTDFLTNLWFTRYLWGVENGVENRPKSWVVREAASCPPRQTTTVGEHVNTATLTVADTSPFLVGNTLTVPQRNADGTTTNVTRLIVDIPDATHLTLASAVATDPGQTVAAGTAVFLACNTANPTPYPEWPDPATGRAQLRPTPGAPARGGLALGQRSRGIEALTDDPAVPGLTSANAPSSTARLIYQTAPLSQQVRISGTPTVSLEVAFGRPKANLTAALVSYPPTGDGTILTRGWIDPENRSSDYTSRRVRPGVFYTVDFDLQPKDSIVPAGHRLALMVLSTDRDFTIRPSGGTRVSLDLRSSRLSLPVVGGQSHLDRALTSSTAAP